jgi:putative ABC transport system permease protein
VWLVSARDLQFRARRFIVAIVVTSLVFGIALAIDGMRRSVENEVPAIVELFGADQWVIARGATGPFTTTRVLPAETAEAIRAEEGVRSADPVVLSRTVIVGDPNQDANLIGHVPDGLGSPPIADGRGIRGPGEAVVSPGTKVALGDEISVGGKEFRVVGTSDEGRYYFGVPTVFVSLEDSQEIVFKGQPLAMGVAVDGDAEQLPPGVIALTNDDVEEDLRRPLAGGVQSIVVTAALLWFIAAGIIGLIVYLSALERLRDFAVFKATGAPSRVIVGGLMLQAVFVSLVAALLAVGVSKLVGLGLPFPSELGASGMIQLIVIAVVVGVLASLAGVRRALGTDPAVAFGGQ